MTRRPHLRSALSCLALLCALGAAHSAHAQDTTDPVQQPTTPEEQPVVKETAPAAEPAEPVVEEAVEAVEEEEDDLDDLEDLEAMMDEVDEEELDTGTDRVNLIEVSYTPEDIAKTGGSVQIIDEETLNDFQSDDVHDVVTRAAGVYVREEDGFGLRPNIGIRGANSERSKKITLMEDGILFGPAPYSAPAAYYFPMMQRITGVEIFKGPGAIIYGPNTIGGALNFTTRKIKYGHQGGATLALGMFPSGKLHAWHAYGSERFGVLGEAAHLRSAGFKEIDGGGDTGFNRSEATLKGHINSDPSAEVFQKLGLKATFSHESSQETYLGLTDADFEDSPYRRYRASALDELNMWRLALRADHAVEFGEALDVRTVLYRHDMSRAWKKFNNFGDGTNAADVLNDPTARRAIYYDVLRGESDSSGDADELVIGTNARAFFSQGLQSTVRHRHETKTWSNKVEAGVRVHQDQIKRDHSEERYRMEGGALVRTSDDETFPTRNTEQTTAVALWALDQVSFWRLTLTPGLRYELIRTRSEDRNDTDAPLIEGTQSILIPGVGSFLDLGKNIGVLAGVHRGFSPVSPGQGNEVQPETSLNYEGGVRYDNLRNSRMEAIGFFNDYKNMTGQCTFSAGCQEQDLDGQFNAGRAWIYGAEILIGQTVELGKPGRQLEFNASYTFTQTELLTSFQSNNPQLAEVDPGDELPYVPKHQASLSAGYQDANINANVGASYIDSMREIASQGDEGIRTDAFLSVDALISYKVWRELNVYGKGNNLLNAAPIASRRPYGARPISPRYLELGVNMRWGGEE